jgi:hypothetical protein
MRWLGRCGPRQRWRWLACAPFGWHSPSPEAKPCKLGARRTASCSGTQPQRLYRSMRLRDVSAAWRVRRRPVASWHLAWECASPQGHGAATASPGLEHSTNTVFVCSCAEHGAHSSRRLDLWLPHGLSASTPVSELADAMALCLVPGTGGSSCVQVSACGVSHTAARHSREGGTDFWSASADLLGRIGWLA